MTRIVLIILIISALLTLLWGNTPLEIVFTGALERVFGVSTGWNALLDDRLPRMLVLIMSGASLALAGCISQSLFSNPLASPTVLGVSGGASLGALFALWSGLQLIFLPAASLSACLGAFLTLALLFLIGSRFTPLSTPRLLLIGIALTTFLYALQGFFLYLLKNRWDIQLTLAEWQASSTAYLSWNNFHVQFPLFLIGLALTYQYREALNLFALGEIEAKGLGVDVQKTRWIFFLTISLFVAGTFASLGDIPFFGLLVPHIGRTLVGPTHKKLLPFAAMLGAAFLLFFDFAARLIPGHPLTLGHIAGLTGSLFFLFLLLKPKEVHVHGV